MNDFSLNEGEEFNGVLGELIIDPETGRRRVVTNGNSNINNGIFIECSKKIRENKPLGTIFKINVKVSRKPIGRLYLHSLKKLELLTLDEWHKIYG